MDFLFGLQLSIMLYNNRIKMTSGILKEKFFVSQVLFKRAITGSYFIIKMEKDMKKLLLITAVSTTLLSSIVSFAEENDFYVKVQAGAIFLRSAKDKAFNTKMKAKVTPNFGAGVGYYVMDNVRADLTLNFLANPQFKKPTGKSETATVIKHKGRVMSLLVSGYVDLWDAEIVKLFAGLGAGWAQVKEKIHKDGNSLGGTKKANNLAYRLSLGVSGEVADGVAAELTYNWKDYGKTKKITKTIKGDDIKLGNTAYRGHDVTFAIRFNI